VRAPAPLSTADGNGRRHLGFTRQNNYGQYVLSMSSITIRLGPSRKQGHDLTEWWSKSVRTPSETSRHICGPKQAKIWVRNRRLGSRSMGKNKVLIYSDFIDLSKLSTEFQSMILANFVKTP